MIRNYIKTAWRNLARNKVFSFINIFGLAAGLATCLLIMFYIIDESSYDKHHDHADRLFRISGTTGNGDGWAAQPAPIAWTLKNELPEVEEVARLLTFPDIDKLLVKYEHNGETKQFFESNGYYVDSTFFKLFSYNFINGSPATALNEPSSLVLSAQMARKLFEAENPLGKTVIVTTPFGEKNYKVTGVFDNGALKSHIPANYFLSMRNNDMWNWVQNEKSWISNNIFFTYAKLKDGVKKPEFEKKLQDFFLRHAGADLKSAGFSKTLFLQPVPDIYLHSAIGNEIAANGNITYLYILGSIAVFILVIACINFMNLSTARSVKRAREVGVRKVMGAERKALVGQFLGESFMMCVIALFIALCLTWMLLPLFNNMTHKSLRPFDRPSVIAWISGLTLITGLLAGLYPAFYLSSFKPVLVLKGKIINSFSATAIRKGLVVFQFTISICLVLGAIVIWQQLAFLQNQELGFKKEQQVVLPMQYENTAGKFSALKNELLKNSQIKSVTGGSSYPGIPNLNDLLFYAEGKTTKDNVDIGLAGVENDYIKSLGFSLIRGRSFSNDFKADSLGIVVNEAAIKKLGYKLDDAVGRKIFCDFAGFRANMQIIGVVKDFNFESLHVNIKPFGFTSGVFTNKYSYTIATLATTDYSRSIKEMQQAWNKVNPSTPFTYSFIDQDFQRNYGKEQLTANIVAYFTLIAILVACLGLFGLTAFSAEQRTKEIGIRKVLGASVTKVTVLLSKEFIKLILIAMVIASPIAWWAMTKWLQNFAYRISVSWWMILSAGLIAMAIALVTISFQSIKAAMMNPVKSLKAE